MKRRIISLILILIIAFGAVPLSTVFAADSTSVIVTADKTATYQEDTVLFTVSVGAVNHLMGAEFVLNIPSGMSYIQKSAKVADGLKDTVGFVAANWTESTMKFTAFGDGDYSNDDLTVFLTFSCKIDDNTLGEITPQITDVVLSDTNFEEISTSVNTDGAVVTVSTAPVSATGVTLNKNTLSLYTGDSETLIANLIPANSANKTVSWKSDDTSVATVDDNGKVTAIKKGSTTVTVTTADGGFTDTCTVDVACSHSNKTVHPAVASTCLVGGNGEYTTCDDCGEVISGSSAQLPLGDHNYIDNAQSKYLLSAAQCNKKAVYYKSCSVCGVASSTDTFEYGEFDLNNHIGTTYIKNQKEATCYEEGYTGDTYCSDCNAKLSSGTVIGKNDHNPASVWSTDENYHWHDCQTVGCGNLIDKAAHSGGEATCTSKAVCEVCHVEYGKINPNNHKNTTVINAKPATEDEEGYTGDTYCLDCQKTVQTGQSIKKLDHTHNMVATSGKCGENTVWELNLDTGVLNISGNGDMYDYANTDTPWYESLSDIKSVVFGKDVATVSAGTFSNCENLKSITVYNANAVINDYVDNFITVIGNYGSKAHRYAIKNGYEFIPFPETIEIFALPKQIVYAVGEDFDTNGLAISVCNPNGTVEYRYKGFTVSGYDNEKVGKQTLTVEYLEMSANFEIEVKDGILISNPNAQDLTRLRKMLLETEKAYFSCDFNGDGVIDIRDLVRMKKYLADNTTPLGKQKSNTQTEQSVTEVANIPGNKQIA